MNLYALILVTYLLYLILKLGKVGKSRQFILIFDSIKNKSMKKKIVNSGWFLCNSLSGRQTGEIGLHIQENRKWTGTCLTINGLERNWGDTVELISRMTRIWILQNGPATFRCVFDLKNLIKKFQKNSGLIEVSFYWKLQVLQILPDRPYSWQKVKK